MKSYSIGVDIGGTKCAVVLGNAQIEQTDLTDVIIDRICFQTESQKGPDYVIGNICLSLEQMLLKHHLQPEQIAAIGISCGGPLDHIKGIVMNPPNLYGWDQIPIVKILEERFHIPTFIQNDANACALAEWRFGAARGYKNVIFLTCGTGMGAGLILDGKLYAGTSNMAGEVGHIRLSQWGPVGFGKTGSFEGFCSGGGIAQIAKMKVLEKLQMGEKPALCPEISMLEQLNAKNVAIAAESGDELAKEIYRISGHYLGVALSLFIDILNPEMIVIGSIYERSGDLLRESMMEVIQQETLEFSRQCCQVVPARLGDQIGDFAALSVALQGAYGKDESHE
ncbi:MAG: ROK family protein [Massiliimalia sp.]|jgi:glucokinase